MEMKLGVGDTAPDFSFETPGKSGLRFYEECGDHPAVLVFLRYLGCPVCQMEMVELRRNIDLFNQLGARVFVFLQSDSAVVASSAGPEEWPYSIVCDPGGKIFVLYGVAPGGLLKYLHPAGLMAAVKATLLGHRHGKFEGKETQVPAAFVISSEKTIRFAHYGRTINDVPPASVLAGHI